MNEPIVSPLFIYLLSVLDNLNIIFEFAFLFSFGTVLVFIVGFLVYFNESAYERSGWDKFWTKKVKIFMWVSFTISLIEVCFTPSSKTILSMYVAKQITPQVVSDTIEEGKSLKDVIKQDIIDIIQASNKDNNKETEE